MIGYLDDKKTKLEEIKVDHSDVLALEGTVRGSKIRIILAYFDSTKNKSGKDFERNRKIQKLMEKLMDVDPDMALICLGDINGRLTKLEPHRYRLQWKNDRRLDNKLQSPSPKPNR